ncbi:MAG: response regulator transcription factor [Pseudomonadota bacterium]|nr:response regulator transcription factor [Pseudomonadota bacterium]
MRLLLVEDDTDLAAMLRRELKAAGFAVDHASDGVEGEFLGNEAPYEAIVLDLGLPRRPGVEVLLNWRRSGNQTPVLILTARDSWHERVDGLKSGADDYLGKPFHVEELIARVNALVRRSAGRVGESLETGGLRLDEDLQRVFFGDGESVPLTGTEFRLLRYFMLNPGKVLSKDRLLGQIYDDSYEGESNLIEVYVRRLREKIGKEHIRTQRGQGYLFLDPKP